MMYQSFHGVSAILYILSIILYISSAIPCLGQSFYPASAIFVLCQALHVLPAISCCANHFHVVSLFSFVSIILLFYQLLYIYCLSFFADIFFFLCELQVYYIDNLLSNVPVPAGTPRCQFFSSDVIDNISNLDREASRDGLVTFSKLPVSKTFFLPIFSHFYHFIVKAV
jgi:hypothetical protein